MIRAYIRVTITVTQRQVAPHSDGRRHGSVIFANEEPLYPIHRRVRNMWETFRLNYKIHAQSAQPRALTRGSFGILLISCRWRENSDVLNWTVCRVQQKSTFPPKISGDFSAMARHFIVKVDRFINAKNRKLAAIRCLNNSDSLRYREAPEG